jgi:hypothetical protein
VRPLVRPATRGMGMALIASGRVFAGRIVVSRRTSLDVPRQGAEAQHVMVTRCAGLSA